MRWAMTKAGIRSSGFEDEGSSAGAILPKISRGQGQAARAKLAQLSQRRMGDDTTG